jgi:hypothetical protein
MLQAISMYTGFLSVSAVTIAWSIWLAAADRQSRGEEAQSQ